MSPQGEVLRILHVEDSSVDADLVARALKRDAQGAVIDLAHTLDEARRCLQHPDRYQVALIDVQLPDGNGLELLSEIRDRELALAVVMLTGSGDQSAAIASLQSGADDYFTKDVEVYAQLAPALTAALARFNEGRRVRSGTLQVLYAEHNPFDIDLTRRHLARHAPHIRLSAVSDAQAALERLPRGPAQPCEYDVLLLDYRLPGLDALDAVRSVRSERRLEIPIVIVSGQGGEDVAAQSIKLGVDDYIAKHDNYLLELAPTLEKVHRQYVLQQERRLLKKTSEHLAYMLEASPVILYTLVVDGAEVRPRWVSANISRLFGYSPDEVMNPDWWRSRLHPEDASQAVQAVSSLQDSNSLVHEYRFLDKLGQVHWIRDEIRSLDRDARGARELLGAWHDVTLQRRAEEVQKTRIQALDGLSRGVSLLQVLERVAVSLERILPQAHVSVVLYDPRRGCLTTAAAPSLPAFFNDAVDGLEPAVGRGSCGTAAATGETVIVDDVATHPYWADYTEIVRRAGIRACWSVPFKDESDLVLGTFAIYHDQVRSPQPTELQLIEEFAHIAGLAVQRSHAAERLRQAATVFDSTSEGVVITDLQPSIIAVNRAYTSITGYAEREVIGRDPGLLRSGRQDESFYQAMWASIQTLGHWQGEIWNRRKSGELYPQLLTISTVRDETGKAVNYVGVMTDISQMKKSEASLERLAHYDPLTGLPNRLLIQSRLEHSLVRATREQSGVAVLFLDLDRFKNVNDSLGHSVGDELLREITDRLGERLREEDSFGRLGGDEFLVTLAHSQPPEHAASVASQLIELLDPPFNLLDHGDIYIGVSIGISIFPQDGTNAAELIQHADTAMYQAKEQGRNTYRFYTPALTEMANRRMEMEARLRGALAAGAIGLHYQPQVRMADGAIVGCEALLRWHDPDLGMVPPDEVIPLAEETGLIVPLGAWLLDRAAAQLRHWIDRGWSELTLSLNLSGRQLQHQGEFVEQLRLVVEKYRLPPGQFKLELTESVIMGRGDEASDLLRAIKSTGVTLSIDDFGTGYSSLAYLKRFPIDELKIDRSFVASIPGGTGDREIAETIIAMAGNLRMRVIAEGVETRAQAEFLLAHGCEVCQGYLYSPAVPSAGFGELLAHAPWRTA